MNGAAFVATGLDKGFPGVRALSGVPTLSASQR